jgi:hypothetical protein
LIQNYVAAYVCVKNALSGTVLGHLFSFVCPSIGVRRVIDFSVVWCKFYIKSYLQLVVPAFFGGRHVVQRMLVHILGTCAPSGAPKITIHLVHAYVDLFLSNSKTAEAILMKFDNGQLLKSVIVFQFRQNQTKITYCHVYE